MLRNPRLWDDARVTVGTVKVERGTVKVERRLPGSSGCRKTPSPALPRFAGKGAGSKVSAYAHKGRPYRSARFASAATMPTMLINPMDLPMESSLPKTW